MNEELGVTIDGHSVVKSTSAGIKSKSWQGMYDVLYTQNDAYVRIASMTGRNASALLKKLRQAFRRGMEHESLVF
ncbi:unnamed protein product [marine sediment metagenome]|uniref:Uncharacterized protein n=1 Tax=marine sediment metagenome TaxID=412755 RepID=X0TF43_9ZZZZ